MELFNDQFNIVNISYTENKKTLLFKKGNLTQNYQF
jgi:hypothetical protein